MAIVRSQHSERHSRHSCYNEGVMTREETHESEFRIIHSSRQKKGSWE